MIFKVYHYHHHHHHYYYYYYYFTCTLLLPLLGLVQVVLVVLLSYDVVLQVFCPCYLGGGHPGAGLCCIRFVLVLLVFLCDISTVFRLIIN